MKISKEKIKKIIFPSREGWRDKWWYRLINILIIVSTVIVLVLLINRHIEDWDWGFPEINHAYTYSFDYGSHYNFDASWQKCYFSLTSWSCGDLRSLDLFNNFQGDIINKLVDKNVFSAASGSDELRRIDYGYAPSAEYQKFLENNSIDDIVSQCMDDDNHYLFCGKEVKYKFKGGIILKDFLISLGLIPLITISWFVFWRSAVYRLFLYIIYGKWN